MKVTQQIVQKGHRQQKSAPYSHLRRFLAELLLAGKALILLRNIIGDQLKKNNFTQLSGD
jgi:hypothetical protein